MRPFRNLAADVPASFVVFLVAVPLSMGIALASGAPIVSGLIAAAVGGLLVGVLGGAPLQVSGPAAGLAVLVYELVQRHGWPALGAIVVGGGLVQVALGLARVARGALAVAPAVVHGMLAGIGLQIALAQLHVLLGGDPQSSAVRNVIELPRQIAGLHGAATLLGLTTMAIVVLWPLLAWRPFKRVPAALVGVAVATTLGVVFRLEVPRVELPQDVTSAIHLPTLPTDLGSFALSVATVAFVASAESLLCAVATDRLHDGPRANLDRELFAQGAGNVVSGLLGGLPITGVIVRSTANISAGARTRLSTILHGIWVIVATTLLVSVLTKIPLAALAALLVLVGAKLLDPRQFRPLTKHGELSTFLITFGGVVLINLLVGIAIGIVWTALRLLRRRSRLSVSTEERDGHVHVIAKGALTFLGVPKLTDALAKIPLGRKVDIDLDVEIVDQAAFEALHSWRENYEKLGGSVDLDHIHTEWQRGTT